MALEQTVWLGAVPNDDKITYTAREWRAIVDALVSSPGVCGANDFKVQQRGAGANQSFDVLAGLAVIAANSGTALGKYVQRNNDTINSADAGVSVPAPPVSGTREHLVYLRVNDKQGDTTAAGYTPTLGLVLDTGAGIPLGALPKNSLSLAGLTRRAGRSSVIVDDIRDLRTFARGLDASPYTSKTTPVSDRQIRHVTTAADATVTWAHGLGRKPVGYAGGIALYETVSGSIPTGVIVDLTTATTTTVKVHALGTGAFGLHPSRQCWVSLELW